jgi:N-acetylglutamate synthase-like GNAT family acetyltransferase
MRDNNLDNAWAGIEIRKATAADAPAIESILSASFEEYKSRYTNAAFQATIPGRTTILERLKEGPIWVAVDGGNVIGTISAFPRGSVLCLRGLAVPPAERGKALGKLLLVHVARYAFHNGFRRMTMTTAPFLTRANREFEHFGFERSEEGPQDLHGTPIYTMTKQL